MDPEETDRQASGADHQGPVFSVAMVCGTECLTACGCARVCKSLVQQLRREFKENKVISWEIGVDPLLMRLNGCFYIFTFCSQDLRACPDLIFLRKAFAVL